MRFYSEVLADVVFSEVSLKQESSYVAQNKRSSGAGCEKRQSSDRQSSDRQSDLVQKKDRVLIEGVN